jgi:IS30 family transposase
VAPPTKTIDLEEVKKLAQMQCTDEEIAAWFGVSRSTIARRKRKKDFREIIDNGMAQGRISVRRHLFKESQDGNVAATIFLAKNLLGYRNVLEAQIDSNSEVAIRWRETVNAARARLARYENRAECLPSRSEAGEG